MPATTSRVPAGVPSETHNDFSGAPSNGYVTSANATPVPKACIDSTYSDAPPGLVPSGATIRDPAGVPSETRSSRTSPEKSAKYTVPPTTAPARSVKPHPTVRSVNGPKVPWESTFQIVCTPPVTGE